jgi:NDP-sugar pyrophosphorylase family protein
MRPLTDAVPKPALPVLDVPLAAFPLLPMLAAAQSVFVNSSHLSSELERRLGPLPGVRDHVTFTVETPKPLGTAGTLRALLDHLAPTVITCNGDTVSDLRPVDLLAHHRASGAACTLAGIRVASGADIALDGSAVTGFVDRRRDPGAGGARFIGMAAFERTALELLPEQVPAGLGETLIAELVSRGEAALLAHEGHALDLAGPSDLMDLSQRVLHGAIETPVEAPGERLVAAEGRAYVGPGADADGAHVGPEAIVLAGARVGRGATLRRCIVWEGEEVPEGGEVLDAIWFAGGAMTVSSRGPAGP